MTESWQDSSVRVLSLRQSLVFCLSDRESCHTTAALSCLGGLYLGDRVLAHTESCRTQFAVLVTESCRTQSSVLVTESWQDSVLSWWLCVVWRTHMCGVARMCNMTHSYVWRDSFIFVPWLIHMRDKTHAYVWHGPFSHLRHFSFMCVTWPIYMCDMTHSCVWHDSLIRVTWPIQSLTSVLIYICDMTHLYVWHDVFMCVTWPFNTCDMTH